MRSLLNGRWLWYGLIGVAALTALLLLRGGTVYETSHLTVELAADFDQVNQLAEALPESDGGLGLPGWLELLRQEGGVGTLVLSEPTLASALRRGQLTVASGNEIYDFFRMQGIATAYAWEQIKDKPLASDHTYIFTNAADHARIFTTLRTLVGESAVSNFLKWPSSADYRIIEVCRRKEHLLTLPIGFSTRQLDDIRAAGYHVALQYPRNDAVAVAAVAKLNRQGVAASLVVPALLPITGAAAGQDVDKIISLGPSALAAGNLVPGAVLDFPVGQETLVSLLSYDRARFLLYDFSALLQGEIDVNSILLRLRYLRQGIVDSGFALGSAETLGKLNLSPLPFFLLGLAACAVVWLGCDVLYRLGAGRYWGRGGWLLAVAGSVVLAWSAGREQQQAVQSGLVLLVMALFPGLALLRVRPAAPAPVAASVAVMRVVGYLLWITLITVAGGCVVRALLLEAEYLFGIARLPGYSAYLSLLPVVLVWWRWSRLGSAAMPAAGLFARPLTWRGLFMGALAGLLVTAYAGLYGELRGGENIFYPLIIWLGLAALGLALLLRMMGRTPTALPLVGFGTFGQVVLFSLFCRPGLALTSLWDQLVFCLVPGVLFAAVIAVAVSGGIATRCKWRDVV